MHVMTYQQTHLSSLTFDSDRHTALRGGFQSKGKPMSITIKTKSGVLIKMMTAAQLAELASRRISQGVSEDTETRYISCVVDGIRYYAMTTLGQCNVKSALEDAMTIEDWWVEWWDEMHFEVI